MKIKLFGNNFTFQNFREFLLIYKDIFIYNEYNFSSSKKKPFIIDCGAHIGIPLIYFKRKYPDAVIEAFEANPRTYTLLNKNVNDNELRNVSLHNAALASKKGKINFYTHKFGWTWGDAGVKNSWYSKKTYRTISVPSLKLSSYINKRVDLLKIDIEGMEVEVIYEIRSKLHLVSEIIIEFHGSKTNKNNSIDKLLSILDKYKFSYTINAPITIFNMFNRSFSLNKEKMKDPYFLIIKAKQK
ncbi:MAG TPA: FkbM family methyltransferase [Patescibacteria group bacterium]